MLDEEWMDLAVEAGQLREAMATRPRIDLAKGIVMGVKGCSPDVAFDVLREASTRHNVKLVRLADALVRAVQEPDDSEPAVGALSGALADDVAAQLLVELGFRPVRSGSADDDELAQRRLHGQQAKPSSASGTSVSGARDGHAGSPGRRTARVLGTTG